MKKYLFTILAVLALGGMMWYFLSGFQEWRQGKSNLGNQPQPGATSTPVNSSLLLPDLQAEPPVELYIQLNPDTFERELWFDSRVINIGDGPLEMIGKYDRQSNKTRAVQRIETKQDTFQEIVVGYFVYHEAHKHWHFEDFIELEIFPYDPKGAPDKLVATTGKTTYCLHDVDRMSSPLPNSPIFAVYLGCDPVVQGLSVGWRDVYISTLPGQQLNIQNLPDDRYMLRMTADPENLIMEKDDDNNSSVIYIEIRGRRVSVIPAP